MPSEATIVYHFDGTGQVKKRKKKRSVGSSKRKRNISHGGKVRKTVPGKGRKARPKGVAGKGKGTVKRSKPVFRDTNGRFITRRKWERKNLPQPKRKGKKSKRRIPKLKRPKLKGSKQLVEGDRFTTPGLKYEYRQFELPDFEAETIREVIELIIGEPLPHPIAFFMHLEYEDKDGNAGDVGTPFFKFNLDNAGDASRQCYILSSQYEIASVTEIEILFTYSIVKGK